MLNYFDSSGSKVCKRPTKLAFAEACACLAVLVSTPAAHGQCAPQEVAKLFATGGATTDLFGQAVSISGDTMIVGANQDDTPGGGTDAGSAYVFVRSGGVWTQQAQLFAHDGAASDFFGFSVAIDGDTAVVGSVLDNTPAPGGTNAGSAYVYVRNNGVWAQQQKLTAADGAAFDEFGYSVAISGNTIVVGAWSQDTLGTDAGAAYVFVRNEGVWTQQQKLTASDGTAGDDFYAVAISGDTIVVGADFDDTQAGEDAGSAYVFVRNGTDWTEQAHLFASDASAFDSFGVSVAISGNTVVIGTNWDDTSGGIDAGSAYVFVRDGTTWWEQDRLFASDGAEGDAFAWCVAIDGDTAVVGAVLDDTEVGTDAGSAYVFERAGEAWTQRHHLFASDAASQQRLCRSIGLSGDLAVMGTIRDNTLGTNAGSVYVFNLACRPGDLDCNNLVDLADMPHFIEAMLSTGFTGCDISRADVNQDGQIDGRDARTFVEELLGS